MSATELRSSSDEDLVQRSQNGSLAAFEELVSRYERRIYGFVLHLCGNAADAAEVTQEAFVRAFRAIGQFKARHRFAAWLFTIARRKCIDHRRSRPPTADEPLPEEPDIHDPAELLAAQEDRDELWYLARHSLPEVQFQALWLRYAEEMNVAEVARVLRKTRTHVKVMLFRARRTLGQELKRKSGWSRETRPSAGGRAPRIGALPALRPPTAVSPAPAP